MQRLKRWPLLVLFAVLPQCGAPSKPVGPAQLQATANAGCSCMQKDPLHRWWSKVAKTTSVPIAPCWQNFDRAVADLDVTEEAVAACGAGSEAVLLTVRGPGMPNQGSTIYLRYPFNGCSASDSDVKRREFERDQKRRDANGLTPARSC
jgi:hypothetical protein